MHKSTRTKSFIRGLIALMVVGVCSYGQTWPAVKCGPTISLKRIEPLVLTYVANAGVLVASGESKVLVDALFCSDRDHQPAEGDSAHAPAAFSQ